jgi:nicotinate-nucleotide adenylyltransferase
MALGTDAFEFIEQWHRASELSSLCHIILIARAGYPCDINDQILSGLGFKRAASVAELKDQACGLIFKASLTPLEISSSYIRQQASAGFSIRYLVTDDVWHYICDNDLYRSPSVRRK